MVKITTTDRLVFALLFSTIIHLIIVLGVSFDVFSKPTNAPVNNLEITLVKQRDQIKPEKADFLAQADNEGGGEADTAPPEPAPPRPDPETKVVPDPQAVPPVAKAAPIDSAPVQAPTPEPVEPFKPVVPEPKPKPAPPKPVRPQPEKQVKPLTQIQAEHKVEKVEKIETKEEPQAEPMPPSRPSARDLILQAHNDIHDLQKKLDQTSQALSKRPKKRRISAATKEYAAAAYMKAWELKVEKIGNMNYPQEARKKGLSGSLILSVDINPDGSVPPDGIVISRSSGHKVLDDAAIRIVQLGAPYAAIPEEVLQGHDMLTIIRTWKFETGKGLSTR